MKRLIIFPLLFVSSLAIAQTDSTLKTFINPSSVNQPKGYSQAVTVDLGNCTMLTIAGQLL